MKSITALGAASVFAFILAGAAQASVRPTSAQPMVSIPSQSRTQGDLYAVIRSGVSVSSTSLFAANTPSTAMAKPKRKIIPVAFTPGPFDALDNPAIGFSYVSSRGGPRR